MSNVSRISRSPAWNGHGTVTTNVALVQATGIDDLRRLPTELRLIIFHHLLNVYPKKVFCGGRNFGPLHHSEFHGDGSFPWQILATCRQYCSEASPIMYGQNHFVVCTGRDGEAGLFEHTPFNYVNLTHVKYLSIYFRVGNPEDAAAQNVAKFIDHINTSAYNLRELTVMPASNRYHDGVPWDTLFYGHPVYPALERFVACLGAAVVKIRLHDGAALLPMWPRWLLQSFEGQNRQDRRLVFSRSCSCSSAAALSGASCSHCGAVNDPQAPRSTDLEVTADSVETTEQQLMDTWADLQELGAVA